MRIAIYARVSTDDKGQDPENQLRELRQWCASAGHRKRRRSASGRRPAWLAQRRRVRPSVDQRSTTRFDVRLPIAHRIAKELGIDRKSAAKYAATIVSPSPWEGAG